MQAFRHKTMKVVITEGHAGQIDPPFELGGIVNVFIAAE